MVQSRLSTQRRTPSPPTTPRSPDGASRGQIAGCVLLLLSVVTLAYSNSFQGEFVFDDLPSIVDNPSIRRLWPPWEAMFPPVEGGKTVEGRPLVGWSLALNYDLSGLEVWSYHVFNLLVHLLATLTLFGVVRRTLLLPRLSEQLAEHSIGLALAVAMVWGVHPLATQAVAYIVQRAESMVALFYLLTLYCVIRGEGSPRPRAWFTLAVLCCTTGMATKEVMATAPLVVMLFERVFVFDSWRETWQRRRGLFAALAATWAVLGALVVATGGRGGSVGFEAAVTPWEYFLTQCVAIVHYLRLCFSPSPLILDYGAEPVTDPAQIIPCAFLLAALLLGSLLAWRWKPPVGFLGVTFFLILAPSSSVVPIVTQVISEHRMYLPLAAVVTVAVFGFHYGWRAVCKRQRATSRDSRILRLAPAAILGVIVVLLGLQTWLRNLDYRTSVRIWEDTVAKRPGNARAYSNLGQQYFQTGNPAAAMEVFQRGIERLPKSHVLYYNRGTIYLKAGKYAEAEADLSRAIELKTDFVEAYQNRGVARRLLRRYQGAIDDFTKSLDARPGQLLAYKNRALAYQALGEVDQARADARKFLELGGRPDHELLEVLEDDEDHPQ